MTTVTNTADTRQDVRVASTRDFGKTIATLGDQALRYSIALVLFWIGAMKFTAYEAAAIEGLVASSPLTAWLYAVTDLRGAANLIGLIEVVTALALVIGPLNRSVAIGGAIAAIITFTITLSFLFTAPGWEASLGGFPALSVVPGQFLLKDVVLLAASVSLLGRALRQ